jgi:Zn-dependent protease/CBS domain-containing protein
MGWSFKIGRIFGIDFKIHFTFFLILIWGALNFGGDSGPLYGLAVTVALFTLVLLHELGHSLAAMGYGIGVKDISRLPIGGVARLERMPEKPFQELVVALAGPAVNVLLAMILLPIVLGLAAAQPGPLTLGGGLQAGGLSGLLTFLLTANISLAIFNMIPAFPMDGGRVFRAVLGLFVDFPRATRLAVVVGRVLAVGLGLVGIFTGQFFLALIALFIFTASGQEGQAVAAKSLLRNVPAGQALPRNTVTLSSDTTVGQAASMATRGSGPEIAVLDPHNRQFLGVVSRGDVAKAVRQDRWYTPMTEIMQPAGIVPRVTPNTTLAEVYDQLTEGSIQVAAVYDGPFFRGLISLDDIGRAFQLLSQRGSASQRPAWETSS